MFCVCVCVFWECRLASRHPPPSLSPSRSAYIHAVENQIFCQFLENVKILKTFVIPLFERRGRGLFFCGKSPYMLGACCWGRPKVLYALLLRGLRCMYGRCCRLTFTRTMWDGMEFFFFFRFFSFFFLF